jgi:hypothetical protein
MKNTTITQSFIRYRLYAQNRNGKLIIKNIEQNNYFVRHPKEVIADKNILEGLSLEDKEFVEKIAVL